MTVSSLSDTERVLTGRKRATPADARQVELSPLVEADLPVLFRWINDRRDVLHSAGYKPISEAQHRRWFEDVQRRPDTFIFAVRLRRPPTLIGTCQLHSVDWTNRSAELQIRIGETTIRGRGYGTEAVRQLVDFGFRDLGLHRISLRVFGHNAQALAVYDKAGFTREAVQRQAAFIDGRYVDIVVMAILNR